MTHDEQKVWFACFTSALTGLLSAKGEPSRPSSGYRKPIIEEAAGYADDALNEIKKRRPGVKPFAEWI